MEERTNARNKKEAFRSREHLKLASLMEKAKAGNISNDYLFKPDIPDYPQPEFHVSHLQHDTDQNGLRGIERDRGFKDPGYNQKERDLVWWSLALNHEDLASAEGRPMKIIYPDLTKAQAKAQNQDQDQDMDWAQAPEQVQAQQQQQPGFLRNFASSPVFTKTSMFGSYRFTFPVEEVLKAYKEQFCPGAPPVMRVYETVLYKKEVMYVVLVHSQDEAVQEKYKEYPELKENDPEAVCCYKDGQFIWRSQAMCKTHSYKLVQRPEINQMEAVELFWNDVKYYIWDCVAIALHMKAGQTLTFDHDRLRQTLKVCKKGVCDLSRQATNGFQTLEKATKIVQELWPNHPPLEEDRSLKETPEAPVKTEPNPSD